MGEGRRRLLVVGVICLTVVLMLVSINIVSAAADVQRVNYGESELLYFTYNISIESMTADSVTISYFDKRRSTKRLDNDMRELGNPRYYENLGSDCEAAIESMTADSVTISYFCGENNYNNLLSETLMIGDIFNEEVKLVSIDIDEEDSEDSRVEFSLIGAGIDDIIKTVELGEGDYYWFDQHDNTGYGSSVIFYYGLTDFYYDSGNIDNKKLLQNLQSLIQ